MKEHHYEAKIVTTEDLKHRPYLLIKVNGKRIKEYNGKSIGLNIKPSSAKSIKEKQRILSELEFQFKKALESGSYPTPIESEGNTAQQNQCLAELLDAAISRKKNANLSSKYVHNMETLVAKLKHFLSIEELNGNINELQRSRLQEFINLHNSSPSYYMIIRRHLKAIFGEIDKTCEFNVSIISKTERQKASPTLHKIYSDDQLTKVLTFLEANHEDLHLFCLIAYGCLLRPHNEIRLLKRRHIKNNCTETHLSGNENKGKKIRLVPIPKYVQNLLKNRTVHLEAEDNIFTSTNTPHNPYYFSTAWTRAFRTMQKEGLIEKNQTIYSFRHTAAVNVYKKTKDLHILQQLLGHSDMIVTLKYLRGLGVTNVEELKNVMPEL